MTDAHHLLLATVDDYTWQTQAVERQRLARIPLPRIRVPAWRIPNEDGADRSAFAPFYGSPPAHMLGLRNVLDTSLSGPEWVGDDAFKVLVGVPYCRPGKLWA